MAIDRRELIGAHDPVLDRVDQTSPLTVGNGEIGFTADVTGMQTLYDAYRTLPLCTLSRWGWHTRPVSDGRYAYTLRDLVMTDYRCGDRTVRYPQKKQPGNGEVYDWLRENPHRLNLGRIRLLYRGRAVGSADICRIRQELHLYEGMLERRFQLCGVPCLVKTACDPEKDCLGFIVESRPAAQGDLQVEISFPYGSPDITASDWNSPGRHETRPVEREEDGVQVRRTLDRDRYFVSVHADRRAAVEVRGHTIRLTPSEAGPFGFTVAFAPEPIDWKLGAADVLARSARWWENFWEKGGIVRLNRSRDPHAVELERRIILSQYLTAVNSAGYAPPQETGLTCNSWYGKMHLEMYLWHCAWLPLWNHTELLERSLAWYRMHLPQARENAARNGYKGARWPKMIALDGIDSPSPVAPLLVWQQPHIIYMLETAYQSRPSREFLEKYGAVVRETADFMADFVRLNPATGQYDMVPPVIPVQECHRADVTRNPAFELEYWHVTLRMAEKWAQRLGREPNPLWRRVYAHLAPMKARDGLYLAHENCPDTFAAFNRDHPSMTGAYGRLAGRADPEIMRATLHKVLECWNYPSLWGWDFAMMAMTATRLGEPETAVDILLKDTFKNRYVASGHNWQQSRPDLPLYLPGNGSLLLAVSLMAAGWPGCREKTPGFPKDGSWTVEYEGIRPFVE